MSQPVSKNHPKFVPLTIGTLFNSWTVIAYAGNGVYKCQCKCGLEKPICASTLRSGYRKACISCSTRKVDSGFREVLSRYKSNAKKSGREFSLSDSEVRLLLSSPCYYCGTNSSMSCRGFLHNGIDRKDNVIGYVAKNSVPCCKLCNHMKHILSVEVFLSHVNRICEHRR